MSLGIRAARAPAALGSSREKAHLSRRRLSLPEAAAAATRGPKPPSLLISLSRADDDDDDRRANFRETAPYRPGRVTQKLRRE